MHPRHPYLLNIYAHVDRHFLKCPLHPQLQHSKLRGLSAFAPQPTANHHHLARCPWRPLAAGLRLLARQAKGAGPSTLRARIQLPQRLPFDNHHLFDLDHLVLQHSFQHYHYAQFPDRIRRCKLPKNHGDEK